MYIYIYAPTVSNCFPLHFQKKMGLRGKFFFAKKWRIDNFGMITPGRSRLFPTVSVSLERQLDLWTTDSTKITTFNTFPDDPSARRLLEMMHFDFETQYTLKIPKPQDLVKFNIYIYTYMYVYIYIHVCSSLLPDAKKGQVEVASYMASPTGFGHRSPIFCRRTGSNLFGGFLTWQCVKTLYPW